jgi:hypothetical protein
MTYTVKHERTPEGFEDILGGCPFWGCPVTRLLRGHDKAEDLEPIPIASVRVKVVGWIPGKPGRGKSRMVHVGALV